MPVHQEGLLQKMGSLRRHQSPRVFQFERLRMECLCNPVLVRSHCKQKQHTKNSTYFEDTTLDNAHFLEAVVLAHCGR